MNEVVFKEKSSTEIPLQVEVGDLFLHENSLEVFIVACVDDLSESNNIHFTLTSLDDGNRWDKQLPKEEFIDYIDKLVSRGKFRPIKAKIIVEEV